MITTVTSVFGFKVSRFFYSRFFGLHHFCAGFYKPNKFHNPLNIASGVNFAFTMAPSIIIDLVGLIWYRWGTQFYITCIEHLVLNLIIVVLTLIEFKTAKIYSHDELNQADDAYAVPSGQMEAKL